MSTIITLTSALTMLLSEINTENDAEDTGYTFRHVLLTPVSYMYSLFVFYIYCCTVVFSMYYCADVGLVVSVVYFLNVCIPYKLLYTQRSIVLEGSY